MLTAEDIGAFERDGYLIVRGMYARDEVRAMAGWIDALVAKPPVRGGDMVYLEDSRAEPGRRILSRIEKFAEPGTAFGDLVHSRKTLDAVEALLGGPALLFKEKINFKLPGGGGFEPHQDIQPGWDDYAPYFISLAIAIDPSTIENGCLEVAPGHHRRGLIGERWKPLGAAELEGMRFDAHPMAPGDVMFFDCFVPHQSQPNATAHQRRNVYLTFNRAADGEHRERYFADKRRNFPPDHEREPGTTYVYRV
jgi:ectoine hydroxylase-related dioxygenase (phytanoyl-CoA dioxygenase family)